MVSDVRSGITGGAAPSAAPSSTSSSALSAATPVTFGGLFGWLHPAAGRRGVVLCGAHGFEQLAAHRPWRALAEGLAAAGCPTLRFDYPGEGDSGDASDAGEVRVETCVAAIGQAVRFLREATGVTEVVLVGLRLGANLAVLTTRAEPVDRLVLLAPAATGRAYLREMRLRARTVGGVAEGPGSVQTQTKTQVQASDSLSVGGFRLGPAFLADLQNLDASAIVRPPAPQVLLLASETKALAARLTALGSEVEAGPFPGLAALIGDPIFAEIPDAAFARVTAFAAAGMTRTEPAVPLRLAPARLDGPGWTEAPVRFHPDLFGIRCSPRRREPDAPTVLFVSTGMTVHSGWGRQTTDLARSLATDGVPSLRFDLAGIGDSGDRPDARKPPFAPDGFEDIRCALDAVAETGSRVVLVGNCSGAYAAFQALCRDARVDGALLINLYCFDWDPGQDVDAVIRQVFGSTSTYAALLTRGATWRRLLSGQIRVGAIGATLARRGLATALRRLRRLVKPVSPGGSAARRVARLRRRGATIRLIYSAGDPGLAALRRHLGRSPGPADRRLGAPVTIVPDIDHNFSSAEAPALLGRHLREVLRAVQDAPRPNSVPAPRTLDPRAVARVVLGRT
ncbi:alpha/beta fold hydrolase [Methylobacterium sp. Leaf117]|uniref:alpha/beta fold hydrolase n=1 Tax=Methylobacterium sp. Leaf117 TaxID=1736260 RepID=UPI000A8C067D|nr:alpha/beta fold hydrolase [Methylobacterium sp. Leaf117]